MGCEDLWPGVNRCRAKVGPRKGFPGRILRGGTAPPPQMSARRCMTSRTRPSGPAKIAPWQFDEFVAAEVDGYATPEQIALLEADPIEWRSSLQRGLREREEHLKNARSLRGDEREQVLSDLSEEVRAFSSALVERFPEARPRPAPERESRASRLEPGPLQLHLSWEPGRVIAWAAGHNTKPLPANDLKAMLDAAGAHEPGWVPHAAVS